VSVYSVGRLNDLENIDDDDNDSGGGGGGGRFLRLDGLGT
jgi:hypothetical protein